MRQCHNLITNQKYMLERTAGEQHFTQIILAHLNFKSWHPDLSVWKTW